MDAQAVDEPPSARFTWSIENFSKLNAKKQYSEVFVVGGFKWYLTFWFPHIYFSGFVVIMLKLMQTTFGGQASAYISERQ